MLDHLGNLAQVTSPFYQTLLRRHHQLIHLTFHIDQYRQHAPAWCAHQKQLMQQRESQVRFLLTSVPISDLPCDALALQASPNHMLNFDQLSNPPIMPPLNQAQQYKQRRLNQQVLS